MRGVVAATLVMVGCFGPDLPGDLRCSEGRCPSGFVCDNGQCRRMLSPIDAAIDAASADAPVDALVCGTASFRQGVDGYTGTVDTTLSQDAPGTPQGDEPTVEWDGQTPGGGVDSGLIRFDDIFGVEPGQIPIGAEIASATLEVEVINTSEPPAGSIHDVEVNWVEGSVFITFGPSPGVDPADIGPAIAEAPFNAGTALISVTGSLAAVVESGSHDGWAIVPADGNVAGAQIASSEAADVDARPRLTVEHCR